MPKEIRFFKKWKIREKKEQDLFQVSGDFHKKKISITFTEKTRYNSMTETVLEHVSQQLITKG